MSQRVVFTFDDRSYVALKELTERCGFSSMGEAVRESLKIALALQSQNEQGFTEVVARSPGTSDERVLVIPDLCHKKGEELRHGSKQQRREQKVFGEQAVSRAGA
jgi:hypothetical protein